MLVPFLAILLPLSSAWAAPTEPSVISIPVNDIIGGNLSHHEAHPNYKLYDRWLESPRGSYIRRDPKAAFGKHSNVVSIDCHSDHSDCFFTTKLSFADATKSRRDLERLDAILKDELQARGREEAEKGDPAALALRALEKRAGYAETLLTTVHWKTYHNLGEDNPSAGFQHYIVWDLKCQTVQFSSTGFQLTSKAVSVHTINDISAGLHATLIDGEPPESTHGLAINIVFRCGGIWTNKCCLYNYFSHNYIGDAEVPVPHKEPMECTNAKDVSNQNCDGYHGGWCGVHIRQWQKNEGPGLDNRIYRFDINLFDADQELIADYELMGIMDGQTRQFGSPLPYTFGISVKQGQVDSDAVWMTYDDQAWGSNDQEHHCDFGAYDSGHRDGDCGFSC